MGYDNYYGRYTGRDAVIYQTYSDSWHKQADFARSRGYPQPKWVDPVRAEKDAFYRSSRASGTSSTSSAYGYDAERIAEINRKYRAEQRAAEREREHQAGWSKTEFGRLGLPPSPAEGSWKWDGHKWLPY